MTDLSGKTALVTGAGRGLGFAYAAALAGVGASVLVNDADKDSAEQAAARVAADGGVAQAHAAVVGTAEVADELIRTVTEAYGRLDVLVTNAGIIRDRMLWKMSDEDFDAVIDVHLRGTFMCARAAVRHMRDAGGGGRLILVGSPAGQRGNVGQSNYAAAKAGIAAMVRTWSMECAKAGITVNAIIPVAATGMTETIPAFAPYVAAWRQHGEEFPAWLRRGAGFGSPEDAAGLVVFLASEAAAGVTGQCVGVGGDRLSLWSHPQEVAVAFHDGGWDADSIAAAWASTVGSQPESVGIPAPKVPAA